MKVHRFSRRDFLRNAALAGAGVAITACAPQQQPQPTDQPPAGEPQPTQQQQQATAPAPATTGGDKPFAGSKITFWSMNYGDTVEWQDMLNNYAAGFKEETGIEVTVEIINWANAFNIWLTTSQGGAHPDCGDQYWLHSFAAIGGGKYGPMPITSYKAKYFPDLEERFYEASLNDVFFQNEFYGLPYRGDIRPMLYRTDYFKEAGLSKPPDNWDEVVEAAKALTKRDANGNVERWGFNLAGGNVIQQFMPYLWSAGGEFMTKDGKTATLDTPEMRQTIQWVYDLVWTHKVMPVEFMEKSYVPIDLFIAGKLAMLGSVSDSTGNDLERDYPDLNDKWAFALPPAGPKGRSAFAGAGYWGVLRGTDKVEQCVQWIAYLGRDENLKAITEYTARVSPNKKVMETEYWTAREWRKVIGESLNYAHTSQHTSPAWSKLSAIEPGGVLYDLFYDSIVKQQPVDEVIKRAQTRAQEEMDKAGI